MNGKIKWFSADKGFGFVTDDAGCDHYFSAKDFKDTGHPRTGDSVSFLPVKNHKGSRASHVRFNAPASNTVQAVITKTPDYRVKCSSCFRLMVPRIITGPPLGAHRHWTPVPKRSVCPFCASTYEEFAPTAGEKMAEIFQWTVGLVVLLIVGAMLLGTWR